MRFLLMVGFIGGILLGGVGAATAQTVDQSKKPTEAPLSQQSCVKLAKAKNALERDGLLELLAMKPEVVRSKHGKPVVDRIRRYISLRERVLFQCPPNVLNATLRARADSAVLPPLPEKGPRQVRAQLPRRTLVPLPVKRKKRFKFPSSRDAG